MTYNGMLVDFLIIRSETYYTYSEIRFHRIVDVADAIIIEQHYCVSRQQISEVYLEN